jgi:hypothetical protein
MLFGLLMQLGRNESPWRKETCVTHGEKEARQVYSTFVTLLGDSDLRRAVLGSVKI